jgi:guanylate kinase
MTTVFIISAPSGSGKSTLVKQLLHDVPGLAFSVSYTTRAPRANEREAEDYHFVTRADFDDRVGRGEFLEHAEVFGNCYGTHCGILEEARLAGKDLVLDIDTQGAAQLRRRLPDAVAIFVLAPSRQILEQRLRARSQDPDKVIERRLKDAEREIRNYDLYDYVVINDNLNQSAETLAAIVLAERVRRTRMEDQIRPILETFGDHSLR